MFIKSKDENMNAWGTNSVMSMKIVLKIRTVPKMAQYSQSLSKHPKLSIFWLNECQEISRWFYIINNLWVMILKGMSNLTLTCGIVEFVETYVKMHQSIVWTSMKRKMIWSIINLNFCYNNALARSWGKNWNYTTLKLHIGA